MSEPAEERNPVEPVLAVVEARVEDVRNELADALNSRRIAFVEALEAAARRAEATNPGEGKHTYAGRIAEGVIEPLLATLHGGAAAEIGFDAWNRARGRLDQLPPTLPDVLTRDEPGDLYRSRADDGTIVRMRKAAVRAGRMVGNAIRWPARRLSGGTVASRTQTIPLRPLAAFHLGIRVPRALSRMVDRANKDLARSTTHVERAFSDWINRVLDESEEGEEPGLEVVHEALVERLGRALELAREIGPPDSPALASATARFRRDLEESGSFMLDMTPFDPTRMARVEVPVDNRWSGFYERAANRLALARDLVALQGSLDSHLDRFDQSVRAVASSVSGVLETHGKALDECRPEGAHLDAQIVQQISAAVEAAISELERELSKAGGEAAVLDAADRLAEGVTRATRQLPPLYRCQDIQDDESIVSPAPPRRDYRLEELAEAAFDALAIEQIRAVSEPLAAHVEAASETPAELRSVLDFNLSTAADDLTQDDPDIAAALELLHGAIESATAIARGAAARLREGVAEEIPAAARGVETAWNRLYARVRVEDQRQDELLGAWDRLRGWASEGREGAVRAWRNAESGMQRLGRRTRARVMGALRRGRTVVLQPQVTDADIERTLIAVQEAGTLTRQLPIVYQRLFALTPTTDPDLTVGRDEALAKVGHLRRRWERGVAPILAVTAGSGAGKTTLLNLLARRVFDDCRIVRLDLKSRLDDPAAFFHAAGAASYEGEEPPEVSTTGSGDDADALQSLAEATFQRLAALERARPVVVMAEPMEHLFTRRVGGADVVEGVLTQLRRSPSNVWWILTAASSAWALLETLAPNAATLVSRLALQPLGREHLEELILIRHRKSGLPLRFDEPPTLSRREQSEARRAPTEEARQTIYREEFFDRLHRVSSGDVTLAQFYWLRSLELDRHERLLRVHLRPPLSFAFLSDLDLDRSFALKAFLDHGTLTPREYAEITGDPIQRSLVLFESLFGLRLIHPRTDDATWEPTAVGPEERYHIHPLVVRPVEDYLVGQRILH